MNPPLPSIPPPKTLEGCYRRMVMKFQDPAVLDCTYRDFFYYGARSAATLYEKAMEAGTSEETETMLKALYDEINAYVEDLVTRAEKQDAQQRTPTDQSGTPADEPGAGPGVRRVPPE